ncbi:MULTISPECIES: hypothetical protein [Nostocales]|uniref:Uncharacterized protein n=3 Tax=Nostocales TaxID=1161 RepID=A0A8S9TG27_9CYAN|nr:hypothetical protein [Tolypothrix bouteillei]KAF3890223.1 hypothetical protein DA73_0400035830 [Tolypothrix bouteillei VB521301]
MSRSNRHYTASLPHKKQTHELRFDRPWRKLYPAYRAFSILSLSKRVRSRYRL